MTTQAPQAPQGPPPPENLTPPADATTTASGLAYKVLEPGTGQVHPDGNDLVVVDYTGWTEDGQVFDSSITRGKPALLPLEALIQGWTEGLQLMTEGAKWRLWIPGDLAYKGIEGRPQGMLIFDVTLREIRQIPPVPDDVAGPPADAQTDKSGLAWKVLEPGTGTVHPGPTDTVEVNYIGWTTDGKWFDSTYSRGSTATFKLTDVIEGWRDGLNKMVEGERRASGSPRRWPTRVGRASPRECSCSTSSCSTSSTTESRVEGPSAPRPLRRVRFCRPPPRRPDREGAPPPPLPLRAPLRPPPPAVRRSEHPCSAARSRSPDDF